MILDQHEIASVPSAPRLLENSLSVFLGRRRDEPGREGTLQHEESNKVG